MWGRVVWRSTTANDATTLIPRPSFTPKASVPAKARASSQKSLRFTDHSRLASRTSTRLATAMITTAARTACGSGRYSGVSAARLSATTPALTTPASWVRAPLAALTAVRENDPLTG